MVNHLNTGIYNEEGFGKLVSGSLASKYFRFGYDCSLLFNNWVPSSKKKGLWYTEIVPFYSSKLEDAFRLYRYLESQNICIELISIPKYYEENIKYRCLLKNSCSIKSEANTLELAICNAFVEYMENKNGTL